MGQSAGASASEPSNEVVEENNNVVQDDEIANDDSNVEDYDVDVESLKDEGKVDPVNTSKAAKVMRTVYLPTQLFGVHVLTEEANNVWRASNSIKGTFGIGYRASKELDDKINKMTLYWRDSLPDGFNEGDGWVRFSVEARDEHACPGGCGYRVTFNFHKTHCCGRCCEGNGHGDRCEHVPLNNPAAEKLHDMPDDLEWIPQSHSKSSAIPASPMLPQVAPATRAARKGIPAFGRHNAEGRISAHAPAKSPTAPGLLLGPADTGTVAEPFFSIDSPGGLLMPPGAEFAVGAVLPNDSHGYTGERDELGQRHGDGVQLFPDGRRYSGQFDANSFHGAAIMEWPDGHRYTGQYQNNHKSGDGFFLWPDGRFYDGQWRMGQRHGHGQYIAAESYVGEYYEGFRHGDGVLTWPDGKRYAGEFFRGALHGSAVMSWPDGRRYLGQYADNQKQGEGLFYWPDGRLYEGQWRKGLRHGASRFVDNSGEEQVGTWHKDRLVSSNAATEPGVRDPFCVPPPSVLVKRPKYTSQLEMIAEKPAPSPVQDLSARLAGAGAFSPETQLALSAQDVEVTLNDAETLEDKPKSFGSYINDGPQKCVSVGNVDVEIFELQELRTMSNPDLRKHANKLHGAFGNASTPVPNNDHGLLGWVYEVQSRHARPLYEAAADSVSDIHLVRDVALFADKAIGAAADVAKGALAMLPGIHGSGGSDPPSAERSWRRENSKGKTKEFKDSFVKEDEEEERPCASGCGYQVTWTYSQTHCCGRCARGHLEHGDRCEMKHVTPPQDDNPEASHGEIADALQREAEEADEKNWKREEGDPDVSAPAQAKPAHRRRERPARPRSNEQEVK